MLKMASSVSSSVRTSSTGKRGSSSNSKSKRTKRQVSKETFRKWQRIYEKEHQSMAWLRAEIDDEDKSCVSTLWCVVFRSMKAKYVGTRISLRHGSMVSAIIR